MAAMLYTLMSIAHLARTPKTFSSFWLYFLGMQSIEYAW